MTVTIIIAVLESYEVVRRQLLHFNHFLPKYPNFDFILVDDGSEPAIRRYLDITALPKMDYSYSIFKTKDRRPWTQPCARNLGAKFATGHYLLFTDIDHIFTENCIKDVSDFTGDKMHFARQWGALDENGNIDCNEKTLRTYSPKLDLIKSQFVGQHYNTFAIRKSIFNEMGGYDKKFCGKYGGDDTDFSDRYSKLHAAGKTTRSEKGKGVMYVYPDPKWDRQHIFHHLRWKQ